MKSRLTAFGNGQHMNILLVDSMIVAGIRTGLQLLQYTRLKTQLNGRGAMDLEEQRRREMVERQQVVSQPTT